MRSSIRATVALRSLAPLAFVLAFAGSASANPGITGYSGKPYNSVSETCTTNCHTAGANPPTLTITIPTTVQAGSTTDVTIVVAGNRTRTSMNAAFSDGVKTIKGTNTDTPLAAQEPTEIGAKVPPPNGQSATYKFSFIAPNKNGPITMWVSGMAANGAGTGGDAVSSTTRMFTVTGADAGAGTDAGSSGTSGSGTSGSGTSGSGTSGGGTSGGGTSGGGTSGTSGTSGDMSSSSGRVSPGTSGDDGGCTIARTFDRGATRGPARLPLALPFGLALSLLVIARRRLRR